MAKKNAHRKPGSERWSDIKGGMAFIVPVQLIRHDSWKRLSPWSHKLIADLSTQYSGYNNGYLCPAWSLMRARGWNSSTTLTKSVAELEHYGILERTQQGGRNRPNLFAFSFRRIDRIEGRSLDVPPAPQPSNAWDADFPPFVYNPNRKRNPCPPSGRMGRVQGHYVDSVCPRPALGRED